MGLRHALLATVALPLIGCGGASDPSPVAGYDDCVSIGGVIYTVDGEAGADDGSFPCSDYISKGIHPLPWSARPNP